MYYVKDSYVVGVVNGVKKISAVIDADTASDLPAYNNCKGIDGELTLGTTAVVVSEGTRYLMNSSGEWKEANFGEAIRIKGRVNAVSDLPSVAKAGWLYFVGLATDTECAEYVYTEEEYWEHIGEGIPIQIDDALSNSSENPVQNKVITQALNLKYDKKSDISQFFPVVEQSVYDEMTAEQKAQYILISTYDDSQGGGF